MLFRFLSILICILLLAGCAHYSYNNVNYQTKEEAFAAQSQNQQQINSQILPTKNKYAGNTLLVIPNLNTVKATAITKRGNPSEDLIDYTAEVSMRALRNMGIFLDKRQIFNKVDIQEVDYAIQYVEENKSKYDVVIYMKLLGPSQAQWMMTCKPKYIERPFFMDTSKAPGAPRTISWLDNIEENLKSCSER